MDAYNVKFFSRKLHRGCSAKKGVLKSFTKFIGKHLCWSLFTSGDFNKKWLQHWCFLVKFGNFFRTPILQNTWERLLLRGFFFLKVVRKFQKIFKSTNEKLLLIHIVHTAILKGNRHLVFRKKWKRTYCAKFCMPYQWVKGLFR